MFFKQYLNFKFPLLRKTIRKLANAIIIVVGYRFYRGSFYEEKFTSHKIFGIEFCFVDGFFVGTNFNRLQDKLEKSGKVHLRAGFIKP
jgi:hypothetical protein